MGSFLTSIGDCSPYPPQHGADTENYLQTLLAEVRYEQKNEESFAVYPCLGVLDYIIHHPHTVLHSQSKIQIPEANHQSDNRYVPEVVLK